MFYQCSKDIGYIFVQLFCCELGSFVGLFFSSSEVQSADPLSCLIPWEQRMWSEPKLPEITINLIRHIRNLFLPGIILPHSAIVKAKTIVTVQHISRHQCFVKQNEKEIIKKKKKKKKKRKKEIEVLPPTGSTCAWRSCYQNWGRKATVFRFRTLSLDWVVVTRTWWIIDE